MRDEALELLKAQFAPECTEDKKYRKLQFVVFGIWMLLAITISVIAVFHPEIFDPLPTWTLILIQKFLICSLWSSGIIFIMAIISKFV